MQEIALAEQAEAYIQEQQVDGHGGHGQPGEQDLSSKHYDVEQSRREWREQWTNINGS